MNSIAADVFLLQNTPPTNAFSRLDSMQKDKRKFPESNVKIYLICLMRTLTIIDFNFPSESSSL